MCLNNLARKCKKRSTQSDKWAQTHRTLRWNLKQYKTHIGNKLEIWIADRSGDAAKNVENWKWAIDRPSDRLVGVPIRRNFEIMKILKNSEECSIYFSNQKKTGFWISDVEFWISDVELSQTRDRFWQVPNRVRRVPNRAQNGPNHANHSINHTQPDLPRNPLFFEIDVKRNKQNQESE